MFFVPRGDWLDEIKENECRDHATFFEGDAATLYENVKINAGCPNREGVERDTELALVWPTTYKAPLLRIRVSGPCEFIAEKIVCVEFMRLTFGGRGLDQYLKIQIRGGGLCYCWITTGKVINFQILEEIK